MPKSAYRLPKGGLTNSGKVLLRMRDGQGVSKKQLSRDFNVSAKMVRKYLKEKKPTPQYTMSPERKKSIQYRREKIKKVLDPLDPAGVPKVNSARRIKAKLNKSGIKVSKNTVLNDLEAMGYNYGARPLCQGLTELQKIKRVRFSQNCNMDTSSVVFTDEKIFDTNDSRKNMWVAPGQTAAPRQKVHWAPKCQVWGAIGVGWRHLHPWAASFTPPPPYRSCILFDFGNIWYGTVFRSDRLESAVVFTRATLICSETLKFLSKKSIFFGPP